MSARTEYEKKQPDGGMAVTHCCIFSKERFGQWHGAGGWGSGRHTAPHFPMDWSSDYNPAAHLLLYTSASVCGRRPENFYFEESKDVCGNTALRCIFDPDTDAGAVK